MTGAADGGRMRSFAGGGGKALPVAPLLVTVLGGSSWMLFATVLLGSPLVAARIAWRALFVFEGAAGGGNTACLALLLAYLAWFAYDFDTPFNGRPGRSPVRKAVVNYIFGPSFWWARRYFDAAIICDYDGDAVSACLGGDVLRPAILACHPHGVWPCGALSNFGLLPMALPLGGGALQETAPVSLLTLDLQFYIPFWREVCIALGLASASRASFGRLLAAAQPAAILVGGIREALDAQPGTVVLTIRERRSLFRYAVAHSAAVFPVFTFGETETLAQLSTPLLRRLQMASLGALRFALPLFYAPTAALIVPKQVPLTTVIGAPLVGRPGEAPEALQERYIASLCDLYARHAERYSLPGARATLVIR